MTLTVFTGEPPTVEPLSEVERAAASQLLEAYLKQVKDEVEGPRFSRIKARDFATGQTILAESARLQSAIFVLTAARLAKNVYADVCCDWALRALIKALARRQLSFDEGSLLRLLMLVDQAVFLELPLNFLFTSIDRHVQQHGLTKSVRKKLIGLQNTYNEDATHAERRKVGQRIEGILDGTHGADPQGFDLNTGEAWTDALLVELGKLDDAARAHWIIFFEHCRTAKSSKPSKKWLNTAEQQLDPIGETQFVEVLRPTLAAIGQSGAPEKQNVYGTTHYGDPTEIHETHANLLRGLVWSTALFDNDTLISAVGDAAEMCFQKIPNVGPRSPKTGNACLHALSTMPNLDAVGQLGRLKSRAKHASTRKQIARALERAAANAGMTEADLEEIAVPTFGLIKVGSYTEALGDFTAELIVKAHGKPQLAWIKPDGKRQKTVPAAMKADCAEELKALKKKIKDIDTQIPAIRFRTEQLLRGERSWSVADFRRRFLDHPLAGVIARPLVWSFRSGAKSATAVWWDGSWTDAADHPVDWIDDETAVTIWHPLDAEPDEVLQWREWLERHEVQQPFKQAHREIYLLTDAERATATYSNRFAAHIIRQHQLSALCQQRGWRYRLQGDFDSSNAPSLELPEHNLCAEFWADPIEDHRELSESFIYMYLTTDQVRFSRPDSYEPLPLAEIPPKVFSEVMRDVDLFVGVTSVGNDPEWADGGPDGNYHDYWREYAFGDLSQTAQTRKAVLERVVPQLKIADRCQLQGKFLVVQGQLRAYKIHLGSGNILMSPNDQYLCIVPDRRQASQRTDNIYLPFEGDQMLSVILSKAFLLADDDKIKDPTIKHQIGK